MSKHTEGPWEFDSGDDGAVIYNPDIGTVANIPDNLTGHKANARLIAASPDLLEAAKAIAANPFISSDCKADVLAAIRKAGG